MENSTREHSEEIGTLTEDAHALLNATAEVGGEKIKEARRRLAAALERAKELAGRAREKVVQGAKATDESIHKHPYQAMAVAFGVGALVGYLISARRSRNND